MSVEHDFEDGAFERALATLRQEIASPDADPSRVLIAFNLEVRLHQFDAAAASLARVMSAAPEFAAAGQTFRACTAAERARVARQSDPALAGRRASLGAPPPFCLSYVAAAVRHAQGDAAGVVAALREVESLRPKVSGTLTMRDGSTRRFTDLVDSDDLTGAMLCTYDGDRVLDIPFVDLRTLHFVPGRSSFESMWCPAELTAATGDALRVRVPAFYTGTGVHPDPDVRTGNMTVWSHDGGYAVGAGQRDFKLVDADGSTTLVGMLRVSRIDFDAPTMTARPTGAGWWERLKRFFSGRPAT